MKPTTCLLICLIFSGFLHAQEAIIKPYNNRIIVVGGGGARGAWGAGFAKKLSEDFGPYRIAYGTSTGSLMAPFLVLNDFETLKKAYTTTKQKDIFNLNPFDDKGELRGFNAAIRFAFGKQTFGKTDHLLKLIENYFDDDKYKAILNSKEGLQFTVTVVNLEDGKPVYKSSTDPALDAIALREWIWASANEPIFMSHYDDKKTKDKIEAFVDGGVVENVPVSYALDYALKHNIHDIDVIVNKPFYPLINEPYNNRKIFKSLNRLIDIWSMEIRKDDLLLSNLAAEKPCVKEIDSKPCVNITVHYFPKERFKGEFKKTLLFKPANMSILWEAGLNREEDRENIQVIQISENTATKILSDFKNRMY